MLKDQSDRIRTGPDRPVQNDTTLVFYGESDAQYKLLIFAILK